MFTYSMLVISSIFNNFLCLVREDLIELYQRYSFIDLIQHWNICGLLQWTRIIFNYTILLFQHRTRTTRVVHFYANFCANYLSNYLSLQKIWFSHIFLLHTGPSIFKFARCKTKKHTMYKVLHIPFLNHNSFLEPLSLPILRWCK